MKLQSARKLFFFLLAGLFLANISIFGLVSTAFAEGTRTWEQSKFDELTKGTATGVAIRSAGGLELAPRRARPHASTASPPTAKRR